jgi:hypothetical protein
MQGILCLGVLKRRKQQRATSRDQAVKDLKVSTWFLILVGIALKSEAGHVVRSLVSSVCKTLFALAHMSLQCGLARICSS